MTAVLSAAGAAAPGYRSAVAVLSVGQILSWAAVYYAFSSFVLPMHEQLGWSKAVLMGAFTLGLAVWGVASYAAGAAIDRGQGRALMTGGSLMSAAGFALWAVATAPWMLYAAWALIGASAAATLYEPLFTILAKRYPLKYRDAITAMTLVGGFASTLSFPAVAGLIAGLGWRGALWAIAAVLALVVAPMHAWALRGPALVASPHDEDPAAAGTLHDALRTRAFWMLTLTFTLYAFISAGLWAHIIPAMASRGLDDATALTVIVWIGPAQSAGRLVYALVGRGVPLRPLGLGVLCGLPLSLGLFAATNHPVALGVFALLFGAANGLVTILRGAVVPEYFGRLHAGRIGGAMSAVSLLARAAAPLAIAWMLLWLPGYVGVIWALAGMGAVSVLSFALAGSPGDRAPGARR